MMRTLFGFKKKPAETKSATLEQIEKLFDELLYFDKQKFLERHFKDAQLEDIEDYVSEGIQGENDFVRMFDSKVLMKELLRRGYTVIYEKNIED